MDFETIYVSVYNNVCDRKGRITTLNEFLNHSNTSIIKALRATEDAEARARMKRYLPQATLSGVFRPTRKAANLVMHSGLICLDIDYKDNTHLAAFDTYVRNLLSSLEYVAYAAHSVGGQGWFALVPLQYPEHHKEQFESLRRAFERRYVVIDRACSDVCRLRTQSYEEDPIVRSDVRKYAGRVRRYNPLYKRPRPLPVAGDDEATVAALCEQMREQGVDITSSYHDWVLTGMALTALGERGRHWFHECSRMNPNYKPGECDKLYNNLLQTTRSVKLGTFIHLCRRGGLT